MMNKTQKRPLITEQDIDDALMLRRGYVQQCEARIAALEAENAALREHNAMLAAMVEAVMDWDELNAGGDRGEGWGTVVSALDTLLFAGFPWAADYGLPLPGAGEAS